MHCRNHCAMQPIDSSPTAFSIFNLADLLEAVGDNTHFERGNVAYVLVKIELQILLVVAKAHKIRELDLAYMHISLMCQESHIPLVYFVAWLPGFKARCYAWLGASWLDLLRVRAFSVAVCKVLELIIWFLIGKHQYRVRETEALLKLSN
ncbi:hypothetical protein BJ508DRAFT_310360 [Ascobolus immersus RN42]|uniref:Uncharacterized protein n=1 Tax=Ascobolus immersus RN42 TaxID=1160509 RepID=A0A3N4HTK6_ASCIM|nr:hypothetical protein BJ508DRAFT_310360 [Ascobolus immersus RN42]